MFCVQMSSINEVLTPICERKNMSQQIMALKKKKKKH